MGESPVNSPAGYDDYGRALDALGKGAAHAHETGDMSTLEAAWWHAAELLARDQSGADAFDLAGWFVSEGRDLFLVSGREAV